MDGEEDDPNTLQRLHRYFLLLRRYAAAAQYAPPRKTPFAGVMIFIYLFIHIWKNGTFERFISC